MEDQTYMNDRGAPPDYYSQVARRRVPGASLYGGLGRYVATGAVSRQIVWPDGAYVLPPSTGLQMTYVSTSANDAAAGTGARVLEVHYLDTLLTFQETYVTLNGLTPVVGPELDIRIVLCMHLHEYGSLGVAAGTITASNGGQIYAQISAGRTRCESSVRMVPAGKRLLVTGAYASATSTTADAQATVELVATELDDHQYTEPTLWIPHGAIGMQNGGDTIRFDPPLPFSPGTAVGMMCYSDKALTVNCGWFGVLENLK